jgi:hypothetical protein
VTAALHEFILAEKADLFHTPNLRYLKNIQIFKVSPTLTYRLENFLNWPVFYEPYSPTVTGGIFPIAISWVNMRLLIGLLKNLHPTLKILFEIPARCGKCETYNPAFPWTKNEELGVPLVR